MTSSASSSLLSRTAIFLGIIIALIAFVIQYPQPELQLDYYKDLASKYVAAKDYRSSIDSPLDGITIVITGATSGIGLGLAKTLHLMGGTIVAIGRSPTKLDRLKKELDLSTSADDSNDGNTSRVVPIIADFSDLDKIAIAAEEINNKFESIDFLINNAGVIHNPDISTTKQGYDAVFGVNYLSHFVLTEKLIPKLKQSKLIENGPKIVQISSSTHLAVDGSDLVPSSSTTQTDRGVDDHKYPPASKFQNTLSHVTKSYCNSKLAQIYHGRSLLKRELSSSTEPHLKVVSICPTWVGTDIVRDSTFRSNIVKAMGFASDGFGIAPILFAMFHHEAGQDVGRDYVSNMHLLDSVCLSTFSVGRFLGGDLRAYLVFGVVGPLVMGIQKFFAKIDFCPSSAESYDEVKQEALYNWSMEAVSSWL